MKGSMTSGSISLINLHVHPVHTGYQLKGHKLAVVTFSGGV